MESLVGRVGASFGYGPFVGPFASDADDPTSSSGPPLRERPLAPDQRHSTAPDLTPKHNAKTQSDETNNPPEKSQENYHPTRNPGPS